MPRVNTTIDNVSPLILYDSLWKEGSASDDSLAAQYSHGTFTLSTVNGASFAFSFNGTGIWVFGAKRPNHGAYTVTVDGTAIVHADGFSADPLFQTPLFSQASLVQGPHTVVVTNENTDPHLPFLDVDFITYESEQGADDATVTTTVIDDPVNLFKYDPVAAWSNFTQNGSSEHRTISDASVTLTFNGEGVTLLGEVGPNAGLYSVSVDGGAPTTYNATKQNLVMNATLFHADNLGAGKHVLEVTNDPGTIGSSLTIDHALVTSTNGANAAAVRTPASLSNGALAGIAIAVSMVVAGIFGFLFFLWWRKRRARRTRQHVDLFESPTRDVTVYPPEVPPLEPQMRQFPGRLQSPARRVSAVDTHNNLRRPSGVDPLDTDVPRSATSFGGGGRTPAWVPGSSFAFAFAEPRRSSDLGFAMPPPPPLGRRRSQSFGSSGSMHEGGKRSVGSIGTMDSADSSTSLMRGSKQEQPLHAHSASLTRLSVMPELPEPRSPAVSTAQATPSYSVAGSRALPNPPQSATVARANQRFPNPLPVARFSIANPDNTPVSDSSSELSQRDSLPSRLPTPRAPTPEPRSPTPPPRPPPKPVPKPLLIIPRHSEQDSGSNMRPLPAAPLSALSTLTPANLRGLPGTTPPRTFLGLTIEPHDPGSP